MRDQMVISTNKRKQRVPFGLIAILLLMAESPHCLAAIYKCTGPDGKITYGDTPCAPDEKSQQVTTAPLPHTVPMPVTTPTGLFTNSPAIDTTAAASDKRSRETSARACFVKAYNEWIRAQGRPLPDNDVRAAKEIQITNQCHRTFGLPELAAERHDPDTIAMMCTRKGFNEWAKAQAHPLPDDDVLMAKMHEIANQCRRPLGLPLMADPIGAPKPIAQKTTAVSDHPSSLPVILDLGRLHGGRNSSYASAISADGKLVVGSANHGNYGQVAFKWTAESGMDSLDHSLMLRPSAYASAVTGDGSVIVGAWNSEHNSLDRAFLWTERGGMVTLGVLPGTDRSSATAVSADGRVVVGVSGGHAFRWSERTGMVALPGRTMFGATALTADGRIVYGDEMGTDDIHVVRWDADGKATSFPNPAGISAAFVAAVTPDGSVAVGQQHKKLDNGRILTEAVAWYTVTNQIVHLGSLSGGGSKATSVNSDGTVIVGEAGGTAFRWTKLTGMESIADWIKSAGGNPASSNPISAMGVSGDGSKVVGALQNGDPYVAIVPSH